MNNRKLEVQYVKLTNFDNGRKNAVHTVVFIVMISHLKSELEHKMSIC